MSKTSKGEPYDLSDSTDWLKTPLPSLAPVDSALRCQVCRDFYNTPMITSCSHTFCSLCIRHCLNNDAKCPTCRKGDQESKLRNNYAVEELVEAFKKARPDIMEHAAKQQDVVTNLGSKRKGAKAEIEDSSPLRKRTRAGRRVQQSSQQSSQQLITVDSEADDEEYVPEDDKRPEIQCPICQDGFPTVQAVESHIDHCTGEPPSKKQRAKSRQTSLPPQPISKANTKRPERLPQLHYSMVKDNALRKKLADLGISAFGSRQLMERRYTEWVTLWNANCDSKNPMGKSELKKELDVWERTQGGGAPMPSRINAGGNIRDKDFDGEAWSRNNDETFKHLVAEARRKRAVKTGDEEASKSKEVAEPTTASVTHSQIGAANASLEKRFSNEHEVPALESNRYSIDIDDPQDKPNNYTNPVSPPETSSQRRFSDENADPRPCKLHYEPPSSQTQASQMLNKEIGISPELASLRTVHP